MPRPTKRKAGHIKVSRDKRGKFVKDELVLIDTEGSTLEIETGLSDDSLSEKLWENDEVSDWGGDVDSEVEQDIRNRLLRMIFGWSGDGCLIRKKQTWSL